MPSPQPDSAFGLLKLLLRLGMVRAAVPRARMTVRRPDMRVGKWGFLTAGAGNLRPWHSGDDHARAGDLLKTPSIEGLIKRASVRKSTPAMGLPVP